MLAINTNSLSLYAQRRLDASQGTLARTIQRLSSGLRVNGAADDAAGLAISERMTSEIRGNAQIQRGINDGISLVQVADGALEAVHGMLQRLRELALQSANGTLNAGDRAKLDTERQQLVEEIDRIANSTSIFGRFPLKGDLTSTAPAQLGNIPHLTTRFPASGSSGTFSSGVIPLAYIPAGTQNITLQIDSFSLDDDLQLFARDGRHLIGTPVSGASPDYVWTDNSQGALITDAASANTQLLSTANGFQAGASYDASQLFTGPGGYTYPGGGTTNVDGMAITYSGDGDRYEASALGNNGVLNNTALARESINIDQTTEDLLILAVGSGQFNATATWDYVPPIGTTTTISSAEGTSVLMEASVGQAAVYHQIDPTPADTATLGIASIDLTTVGNALSAITQLDQALDTVSTYRAEYGAHASVFERAITNLAVSYENHAAARGRIIDADFAAETAALTRTQILQQSGTAMLAQANQLPQQVLALLRG